MYSILLVIAALAGSDEATRTLRGKPLACELDVPATLDVVSDKGHHILAIGDGAGLTVDSKQENLLDPSAVLKEAKEMAAKQDPNAKMTEVVPITIDGHKWLQFTTITTLEGNALTVLNTPIPVLKALSSSLAGQAPTSLKQSERC